MDGAKNRKLLRADIVFVDIPHEDDPREPVLPGLSFDTNLIVLVLDFGASLLFNFLPELSPVLRMRNELELVLIVVLLEDGLLFFFVVKRVFDEHHALLEALAHHLLLLLPLE